MWKPTTEGEKVAVAEFPAKYAKWRQENGYVKQLIGSALPETLFIVWDDPMAKHTKTVDEEFSTQVTYGRWWESSE